MKAKDHIYNLKTNLQEVGSLVNTTTDQHLMYMLDEARAILASQKMDAKVNVIQMAQHVDIKTRKATKEEIGTVGSTDVLVLEIPDPIAYLNGGGIFTVGSTDGRVSYTRISFSQLRTATARKYTGNGPKWFFLDNKIFLINLKTTGFVITRVRGIFDQPHKVEIAMGRYKKLDPFNWEYPLSMKDAASTYKIAMSGDMGWGDLAAMSINKKLADDQREGELIKSLKQMSSGTVQ